MIGCDWCNSQPTLNEGSETMEMPMANWLCAKHWLWLAQKLPSIWQRKLPNILQRITSDCAIYTFRDSNLFVNSTIWGTSIWYSTYDWHSTACFHLVLTHLIDWLLQPADIISQMLHVLLLVCSWLLADSLLERTC